jgi:hypothetical protein
MAKAKKSNLLWATSADKKTVSLDLLGKTRIDLSAENVFEMIISLAQAQSSHRILRAGSAVPTYRIVSGKRPGKIALQRVSAPGKPKSPNGN